MKMYDAIKIISSNDEYGTWNRTLQTPTVNESGELLCPICNDNYLHMIRATLTWGRREEISAISVVISCENCANQSTVSLSFYKGQVQLTHTE